MFRSSNPTLFGRPDGVLHETEALRSTMAGLRRVANSLLGDAQATVEARRLLATLSSNLSVYFDVKEATSYFGTMVAECPDLEDRITALGQAREDLQSSVTSVRRLAFRSADTGELGRRIGGVLDGFEEHERSESDLLQTFFLGGEGRADCRPDAS